MKHSIDRKIFIAVFTAVFAVMLLLNFLSPLAGDDFAHYYGMEGEHVTSVGGIIRNMKIFRNTTNGRVVPHFLVYFFLMFPKPVFNIINAAVSALVAFSAFRYLDEEKNTASLLVLLALPAAIWLFSSAFGEIFLWLSGAVNYSWGLLLDLTFIYPFFCVYTGRKCALLDENKKGTLLRFLFLLLAAVTGAYSENGATATIFTAGILWLLIWKKSRKFPSYMFIACVFAFGGFLFLMLAPATGSTRIGNKIMENIWYCRVLTKQYCTVLLITYAICFVLHFFTVRDRKKEVFSAILVCAGLLSVAVFIFAAYIPPRSFMIIVSFLILAILVLAQDIARTSLRYTLLVPAAALLVAFSLSFFGGIKDIVFLHTQEKERLEIIAQSKTSGVSEVFLPKYTANTMYSVTYDEELSENCEYWYNGLIAKYYGLKSVTALPERSE